MSKYRPYKDERHEAFVLSMEEYFDGWETVYKFPNNYGASVVLTRIQEGTFDNGQQCK